MAIEKRMFGCLVCDEVRLEPLWEILLKCPSCGFVASRLEGSTDLRELYQGDYFKGQEYLNYLTDEAFFRKTFKRRLDQLVGRRAGRRLLEIGSAYGFFLDLAQAYFDVVGYEVNIEAAEYGRGMFALDIRTDDFLEATVADLGGPIDVTVMWDVIEHLERPDLYIENIADVSSPGALLYVTTGDIGSRLARWRGPNWRMIHPPSHVHYFDRQTITRLLGRYGFHVLEIRSVGVARSLLQVLYSLLVLRLGWERAYAKAKRVIPATWGFTLNTGDIMQVVAEKQAS